jgi:hypothetical protein
MDRDRRRDITPTTVTTAVELSDREANEGIRTHRTRNACVDHPNR